MKRFFTPCPNESVTALACSVLAHYGCKPQNPTLLTADRLLFTAPRNVILLLLDGLGFDILVRHLPEHSFLREHLLCTLSSVFPPTTAAAATALETGLFPSQSGWLGWSVFWPELGKNVALYPNTDDAGNPAAPFHVGKTKLKTVSLPEQIRKKSDAFSCTAKTLSELTSSIRAITNAPGPHMVYGYLDEPDHSLHREGCGSLTAREFLREADRQMRLLADACPDSLFFLTADHGFIDVESLCLSDFEEINDTLLLPPSIEPRALNLFIKPGENARFLKLFSEAFKDSYRLYSRNEVLSQQLFGPGPAHPMLSRMLGDYLAVALTPLTLFPNRSYLSFMKATHGGMTSSELTVPLMAWRSL